MTDLFIPIAICVCAALFALFTLHALVGGQLL
jgi:hypothetical protein